MGNQLQGSQDLDFEQYMQGQMAEINSDLNKWGAGEEFGHDPDHNERAIHYIRVGAAERYAERHNRK